MPAHAVSRRALTRPAATLTRLAATLTSLTLAAGALLSAASAGTAEAATGVGRAPRLSTYDSRLLHDINRARVAHGRAPLTATAGTTDVAHRWSCHMGRWTTLSHRPNLVTAI